MLQKVSRVVPADYSGLIWGRIIVVYRDRFKKGAYAGCPVRIAAKDVYRRVKSSKKKYNRPGYLQVWYGSRRKAVVIRTRSAVKFNDGSCVRFVENSILLNDVSGDFIAKVACGVVPSSIRFLEVSCLFGLQF